MPQYRVSVRHCCAVPPPLKSVVVEADSPEQAGEKYAALVAAKLTPAERHDLARLARDFEVTPVAVP